MTMLGTAAAILSAAVLLACGSSSAGSANDGADGGYKSDGECATFAVCPPDLQPTFASIRAGVFATSCGTSGGICHSSAGSTDSGGLDLATDPYSALLGPD